MHTPFVKCSQSLWGLRFGPCTMQVIAYFVLKVPFILSFRTSPCLQQSCN